MQKIHQRKNVGKVILSPMKEPEPEPEPKPPSAEAPKEGVCLHRTFPVCNTVEHLLNTHLLIHPSRVPTHLVPFTFPLTQMFLILSITNTMTGRLCPKVVVAERFNCTKGRIH